LSSIKGTTLSHFASPTLERGKRKREKGRAATKAYPKEGEDRSALLST